MEKDDQTKTPTKKRGRPAGLKVGANKNKSTKKKIKASEKTAKRKSRLQPVEREKIRRLLVE